MKTRIKSAALRWLYSINFDSGSNTYGYVDREFWSWKFKDFNNATWQGGLAGFLDASNTLDLTVGELSHVVDTILAGSLRSQRSNGSFEEAYPYESSYCVTALVLFDLLYCYFCYPDYFSPQAKSNLEAVVTLGYRFLKKTPETHGLISNHLVTGYLAEHLSMQFLFQKPDLELEKKIRLLMRKGGWFPEYGGADAGYQTLMNHYLQAACRTNKIDSSILLILNESILFCEKLTFPDGSFAGEMGSRGTTMLYPSGLFTSFGSQWFLQKHLGTLNCSEPGMIDAGNFVPMFNSWALFWRLQENVSEFAAVSSPEFSIYLPEARLFLLQNKNHCLAFSFANGSFRHLRFENEKWFDLSVVAFTRNNFSTQLGSATTTEITNGVWKIELFAQKRSEMLNSATKSICIRLLGLIFYKIPLAQRLWKSLLSFVLMRFRSANKKTGIFISLDTSENLSLDISIANSDWSSVRFGYHTYMASANSLTSRSIGR